MASSIYILMVSFALLFAILVLFNLSEKLVGFLTKPKPKAKKRVQGKKYEVLNNFELTKLPTYGQKKHSIQSETLYYSTSIQESLVCIFQNEKSIVAVCLLIMDSKIEYIMEDFPDCCQLAGENKRSPSNADIPDQSHDLRGLLAIVDSFSTKWPLCDAVHILLENEDLVRSMNKANSNMKRQKIFPYEIRYDFKTFFQYSDNFVVEIANESIWNDVIKVCRSLMKKQITGENCGELSENPEIWGELNWHKQRIRLTEQNFHREPHAGKMSPLPTSRQPQNEELDSKFEENKETLIQVSS